MRPLPTRARVDDPHSRRTPVLATATVLTAALTATLLGGLPAAAAGTPNAAAADKAKERLADAAAETNAKSEAKKSGKPVEIHSKRTETDDVWANPDGTLTANHALVPVRVYRGGKLVDADTTLAKAADGRIAPAATAVGLSFSGGGTGALVTMRKDGRDVSLTWPKALPAPKLEGNSATYANVLDGVDLRVIADVNGFSHQIVVKTRKAAENPALATLDFGLEGNGVTIRKEANGELRALDPAGKALFSAAKPQMWDSGAEKILPESTAGTTGPTPSTAPDPKTADPKTADPKTADPKTAAPKTAAPKAAAPKTSALQAAPAAEAVAQGSVPPVPPVPAVDGISNGSKEADLGVDLKGSKLTLTPDRKLLTAAETTYPVVIDPVWRDDWKSAWAIAYKHTAFANSANTNYWNGGTLSKEARVGCAKDSANGGTVCAKTFFQVGMGSVWDKQILESTFRIQQKYAGSWSCQSGQLQIWDTDAIGGGTTWNNQPAWKRMVDASGQSFGGRNCPGDGDTIELNVTSAVADAARFHWPAWTMGLKSANDTIDVSWRKFNPDSARISTRYNTPPATPYDRSSDPSVSCTGGAPIGTTDEIVLRARIADNEDNSLSAEFHYWNANDYGTLKTARVPVTSGNMAQLRIPAAPLGSNTYRWDVRGNDGTADGPWAGQCLFTIDTTRPGSLPGVSSVQFPGDPDNTAYARTEGTFKLTSGGETDITKYEWWTESDPKVQVATPAAAGGSVDVRYTPTTAGPQVMYVRSLDASGNRSDLKSYLFYAKRQPTRDKPGDLNGDGTVDLWSVDPGSGQLWMHPGKGDGSFDLSRKLNHASFGNVKSLSHRSSWNEDYYEDLLALRPQNGDASRNTLWVYPGKGDGDLRPLDANAFEVSAIDDAANNHWAQADQVVSIGSVNDDNGDAKIDDSDVPDMLVKEGAKLWLYFGTPTGLVDLPGLEPILLGNADWQNMTVMAPGDLNGDTLPEIWVRDTVSGKIHQYTSKKTTTNTSPAMIDLTVYRDAAVRTTSIGTGFTGAAYPHLSTDGDFEKDGYADLWSRDGNGQITEFPGRVLTSGSAFGPGRKLVLGGTPWSECQAFTKPGTTTARQLCGPILAKFLAKGGTATLGYPTTDITESSDAVGRFVHFRKDGETSDNGSIYWHPSSGAWTVVNGIRQKWMSLGAEKGVMGYPTSDEALTFDNVGWFSTFSGPDGSGGAIYWTWDFGGQSVRGTIYKKYIELGGPSGPLGYPTTDETNHPDGVGRYNHFRHRGQTADTASIYWTTTTGKAWSVRGTIREKWVSLGAEKSFLGYPQSDEYDVYGGPREDFSGGYIRHNHTTGVSVEHKATDRTADKRTDLGGDFNGDGRADIATVYDYGYDTMSLYVAPGSTDGKFAAPVLAHNSGVWNWRVSQSQWVAGDFNGDGRDDLAALYGYDDGSNGMFTFLGQADGTFKPLARSAYTGAGNWSAKSSKIFAGDFNGDGRDDVGMMFDHGGCSTGTHTFLSQADGTFNLSFPSWRSVAGGWCWNESKHVTGDFNGDGRDDMLAMYGHGDGSVEMYTLLGKTDGGFAAPFRSWNRSPGNWSYDRSKLTSGDYNGDGRADAAILFRYDNGRSAIFTLTGKADGGVNEDFQSWSSPENSWYLENTGNPVSGDSNKDGRDDVAIMYNYGSGATSIFGFKARTDGGFEAPVKSWQATAGTW
ncbi:FG-GAP-like repeat-containing protein [Streptomyces sp. ISL-94]|uniref:FG-GAP-like repeat-containing protein n=1 Tax=Streptomyces sp. ISL-94 TaxID=2819190 RepID=UPI001BE7E111|nr:FG-GAP-like repeat-containing protein [Streptomyces sp. ISL-94]MBT2480363.1 VCBS repeat-containing protein [Streptomyces sp. ISL-94]